MSKFEQNASSSNSDIDPARLNLSVPVIFFQLYVYIQKLTCAQTPLDSLSPVTEIS